MQRPSAPKPFARHLVIAAQAVVPSPIAPSESGPDPETGKYKSVPRQRYPAELLKHRFMPYGSVGGVDESVVDPVNGEDLSMDVDVEEVSSPKKQKKVDDKKDEAVKEKDTKKSPVVETKKSKGKKRKGDTDVTGTPTPKKSKKAKTS